MNLMKPLRFKTWTYRKLKTLQLAASSSSALITYLRPSHYSFPPISFNVSSETFYDVLAWRTNRCFPHSICVCVSSFRRSHLHCILNSNKTYLSVLETPSFSRSLQGMNASHSPNFTVLDFLLNNLDYETFLHLLSILKSSLAE